MGMMGNKFVEGLEGFLGSTFLYETHYSDLNIMLVNELQRYLPVKTMVTATAILIASSMFPIAALTTALPHSSNISGLSYMVLANLRRRGSGVDTENSLYP